MRLVSTFHGPSVVLDSVKCFLSNNKSELFLVTANPNHVQVHLVTPTGLSKSCSLDVWGTIISLKAIPVSEDPHSRCNLVLLLGHPDPGLIFLTYDNDTSSLVVQKQLSLFERGRITPGLFTGLVVHPSGQYATVHCYTGYMRVVTLQNGNYLSDADISIGTQNLLSMTFVPVPTPTLAFLRIDHHENIQLFALDLNISEMEALPSMILTQTIIHTPIHPVDSGDLPQLIPIPENGIVNPDAMSVDDADDEDPSPAFRGGVLVTGGTSLLIYELNDKATRARHHSRYQKTQIQKKDKDITITRKAIEKENERATRKRKARFTIAWPWSPITAWCGFDALSYVLGDAYGRLALLSLKKLFENGLLLIPLGEATSACTLTYIANKVVYLGSHVGDSMLLQITPSPQSPGPGRAGNKDTLEIPADISSVIETSATSSSKGKTVDVPSVSDPKTGGVLRTKGIFFRVIETFTNIAPIYDAILADTDGSGINHVVTCSGAKNTGSLNIVRTGADFRERGLIQGIEHVFDIFAIRTSSPERGHDLLLLSTSLDTIVMKIRDKTNFDRIGSSAINTSAPTLCAGNISWDSKTDKFQYFVQVTSKKVTLIEVDAVLEEYRISATWLSPSKDKMPSEIVVANVTPTEVLVGLDDNRILSLTVTGELNFEQSSKFLTSIPPNTMQTEPSALAACPHQTYYATAYWQTNCIFLFQSTSQTEVEHVLTSEPQSATIVSLKFHEFTSNANETSPLFIFAGLSTGSLVHFMLKDNQPVDMKTIALGDRPVSFTACEIEGQQTLFATGSRAVILSYHKKRMRSSPIMLKDTVTAAFINSEYYPSSLVLATPHKVSIGAVEQVEKLHIRSVPLGYQNPKRVEYSSILKVFGVLCRKVEPTRVTERNSYRSSLRIFDDTTYQELAHYNLPEDEESVSITFFDLPDFGTLICVGSYVYNADEFDPTWGKIYIFSTSNLHSSTEAQVHLATSIKVEGCVWALKAVNGFLIATVAGAVISFAVEHTPEGTISITKRANWNHNNMLRHMASVNNTVVVGDVISSVSVLNTAKGAISTVTRAYAPLWSIAIGMVDEDNIITCNDGWNLVAFQVNRGSTPAQLDYKGSFYMGDCVTAFARGSISSAQDSKQTGLKPSLVFVSASGRIGTIIECDATQYDLLYTLQRNLSPLIKGVGSTNHIRYRAPSEKKGKTDAEAASAGFLDGDFIEQGLEQVLRSPEDTESLLAGQNEAERIHIDAHAVQVVYDMLQNLR